MAAMLWLLQFLKKMCNAHEEEFDNAATASVETNKYFNEEFYNSLYEKDKLFTAAAVNGNVHILRDILLKVATTFSLSFICGTTM